MQRNISRLEKRHEPTVYGHIVTCWSHSSDVLLVPILRRYNNKMISRRKAAVQIYILQHHGINSDYAVCDWLAVGDVDEAAWRLVIMDVYILMEIN